MSLSNFPRDKQSRYIYTDQIIEINPETLKIMKQVLPNGNRFQVPRYIMLDSRNIYSYVVVDYYEDNDTYFFRLTNDNRRKFMKTFVYTGSSSTL